MNHGETVMSSHDFPTPQPLLQMIGEAKLTLQY
ncbi:hypothetical protein [Photorhabdus luminescens]|nr:hypothetical protein [Photorhabdus luminescens subsp. venezuelensis]